MFEEIKKAKDLLVDWLILFVGVGVFFFVFGILQFTLGDVQVAVPFPTTQSFAVLFFKMIEADLLPLGVTLVATGPMSALNSQILIAFLLSFLVTFPYLLYRLVRYISPALYATELKALLVFLFPAAILFLGGGIFAYFYIIPPTFRALYAYSINIGATPLFFMEDFVSSVVLFIITVGLLFIIPVFMVLLTFLRILPSQFWWDNWRYAQLGFLIFSAIITPDGSGVSMILLSLPLTSLYAVGALVAQVQQKNNFD